jgi:hypothetical protein
MHRVIEGMAALIGNALSQVTLSSILDTAVQE